MRGSRRFEVALVCTAEGAAPVIWQVIKCCAGIDAIAGISFGRVVDVVTDYTAVLGHNSLLDRV